MIRCSYRTMGVVEPNLPSLSDFLNFKKNVSNLKKTDKGGCDLMRPTRIIAHGCGQKVTHFTQNASCQQSASAASPPLFVSNSWVLDVRDGNDDDDGELLVLNLAPKLPKRMKTTIS